MTLIEFQLLKTAEALPPLLTAMWNDKQGNWDKSHELAQEVDSPEGAWVHAYLHRKEGDASNANYWYQLARKKYPSQSLHQEWEEIVLELLRQESKH